MVASDLSIWFKKDYLNKKYILILAIIAVLSSMLIISLGYIKPFLIIFGIVILFIAFYDTKYFLYLYFFLLPFTFMFGYYIGSTYTQYGLTFLFIAIWLMKVITSERSINLPPRWMIILICFFIIWSSLSDINAGLDLLRIRSIISNLIFFLFVFALYDVINVNEYLNVFKAIIFPFLFLLIYTFAIFINAGGIINMIYMIITRGCDILYPNMIGGIYMIFWPITFSLFLYEKKSNYRKIYFVLSIAFIIAILLSNSRSAYLGTFVSILYFIWFSRKRILWLSVISMIILIYLYSPVSSILNELFLRVNTGVSNRDIVWDVSFKLIKENWFFGIGSFTLEQIIAKFFPLSYYGAILPYVHNAHNYLIQMAVQMGIPGLIFMIYLYYKYTKESIKCQIASTNSKAKALCMGTSAVMFAMIARGMFEAIGIVENGVIFPHIYFWVIMLYPIKRLNNEHNRNLERLYNREPI